MRTTRRTCFSTCSTTRPTHRRVRRSRSFPCSRRPVSRSSSNARLGASLAAAALLLTACEFDKITVSKTVPTIVVHAVLNTSAPNQVVLVERTLTGTITVADTGFNALDPIVSAGGDPVRGATVEILDSAGLAVAGVEDAVARADHLGAGVYRVP